MSRNTTNPALKLTGRRAAVRKVAPPAKLKPGPGRPNAARVAAINRSILTAAWQEFRTSGYDAARMEAIAAGASISKGTLYGRYPTKQALLRAVFEAHVANWAQDWQTADGLMPADLSGRLKHRARKLMKFYCSDQLGLLERLLANGQTLSDARQVSYDVGHKRVVKVISQDIFDGSRGGALSELAAARVADMLMGVLYGWWRNHHQIGRVTIEEAVKFADYAVDVIVGGQLKWITEKIEKPI